MSRTGIAQLTDEKFDKKSNIMEVPLHGERQVSGIKNRGLEKMANGAIAKKLK